jgi:hypothetical protein
MYGRSVRGGGAGEAEAEELKDVEMGQIYARGGGGGGRAALFREVSSKEDPGHGSNIVDEDVAARIIRENDLELFNREGDYQI